MNEHVKEKMLSHLTDLTEEFRALKIEQPGLQAPKGRSRLTMGGVEAQEQTEIDGLRGLVNNMRGDVERLERRLNNESHLRVERPLQELTIRLVRS